MLERERSQSNRAVAEHGPTMKGDALEDDYIDDEVQTRVHRTTIVPPPDDLDIDSMGRAFPTHGDLDADFTLDEPDLVDAKSDDPTRLDHRKLLRQTGSDSTVSQASSLGRASLTTSRSTPQPPAAARSNTARSRTEESTSARPHTNHARADKWYLRVQLDTDCVADLWIRDRTPHNVLVWSEDMASWVPLLTVRELRDAIRDAHDAKTREELKESNFVFVNTHGPQQPQPLPAPRIPAGLAAPVRARPTSHWSQPKPRTISNVPPPMLTTAVPVVATPRVQGSEQRATKPELPSLRLPPLRLSQAQLSQARLSRPEAVQPLVEQPRLIPRSITPPASTVPPVVKSVEPPTELQSGVSLLPDIPRPARIPSVGGAAAAPMRSLPPPRREAILPPPQRTALDKARSKLRALPLVHVERALWLAAGVAVSSAIMLLARSPADVSSGASVQGSPAGLQEQARTGHPSTAKVGDDSATPPGEKVHRIEDLPVVGSTKSSATGHGRVDDLPLVSASGRLARPFADRTTRGSSAAVAPANIKLASTPASTAGGFDAGAARRILTSAASRAGRCAADGPASGSVTITFAPSGFVQNASISGLTGKGVNSGCVLRAFQEARVSPFGGEAVTVRKGFQIP